MLGWAGRPQIGAAEERRATKSSAPLSSRHGLHNQIHARTTVLSVGNGRTTTNL